MSGEIKSTFGLALAALFFLCVPLFVKSDFGLGFFILCLLYSLLGQSWNILGGYAGQMSFGHSAFFGTGAYAMAILQLKLGVNPWLAALVALLAGAAIGAFIGSLSFRYGLKGSYFALVTLAFAEVMRVLANSFEFTGGGSGLLVPFKPGAANLQFSGRAAYYYLLLALVALATAIVWWIERSRFGSYLVAIREDEQAAQALGINTFRTKLIAMVLSAAVASLAGVFYIQYYLFVDSGIAFGPTMSIEAFLAPLIGGAGTLVGPLLGAFVLGGLGRLTEQLSGGAAGINLIGFGVLLLLILRFLPDGLAGLPRRIGKALQSRRGATQRA
jgi:branched-chain amino acid transport system permease protein